MGSLILPEGFIHILRVMNTNIDGNVKVPLPRLPSQLPRRGRLRSPILSRKQAEGPEIGIWLDCGCSHWS